MADYAIVLFRDSVDGDWIAAVPDLGSGVSAFGDTRLRKPCVQVVIAKSVAKVERT